MDSVTREAVEKIAAAVLYEGYVLWPYRRSAHKNQQRWTLGGVYPHDYSVAWKDSDPWLMQTQCLVVGTAPKVAATVRFLHVVERRVRQHAADGTVSFVDELKVGNDNYLAWEEAAEREIEVPSLSLAELTEPQQIKIEIPAGSMEESLANGVGEIDGALVRSWHALEGLIEVSAELVQEDLWRLTLRITNTTPWHGEDRATTLRQTFVSSHTVLAVEEGEFVSLMDAVDTPPSLHAAVAQCENIKTWPVLVGEEGEHRILLSSPIILYDYPQIAPESGGDFFDGSEIDQLMLLNILTLTDEEKAEMRASDPRTREILERSESLTAEDFMNLHGAIREFRVLDGEVPQQSQPMMPDPFPLNPFDELERPAPQSVTVAGVELRKGSRVRLRPRAGGDIMDLVLAGKVAVIEAIEQDYEDQIHLSVTIEDDPGQELGRERVLGHRFFFRLAEVEPFSDEAEPEPQEGGP